MMYPSRTRWRTDLLVKILRFVNKDEQGTITTESLKASSPQILAQTNAPVRVAARGGEQGGALPLVGVRQPRGNVRLSSRLLVNHEHFGNVSCPPAWELWLQ